MNEGNIVRAVLRDLMDKGHYHSINNMYLHGTEADVISVTSSDLLIEYEVKIDKNDYFRDISKAEKMKSIIQGNRVNRFYYVVPKDLISITELFPFAGLIYAHNAIDGIKLSLVKKAPILSPYHLGTPIKRLIAEKGLHRFLDLTIYKD